MEFIRYDATPGERHLGIATIKLYGKIILRYKVIPSKDNASFFSAPASYKMQQPDGSTYYCPAFLVDSRAEDEEIYRMIRENVKKIIGIEKLTPSPKLQYAEEECLF